MSDQQPTDTRIRGQVALILDERRLVINRGAGHGVRDGMVFVVLAEASIPVPDPENEGNIIDYVDREKIRVKVTEVRPKTAICSTYTRYYVRGGPFSGVGEIASLFSRSMYEPGTYKTHTLKATDADLPQPISEDESFVKKGDPVVQVIDDENQSQ
jgi:hypothetical protein